MSGRASAASHRPGPLIALTGGTGFVGSTLIDLALSRGWSVHALARRKQPTRAGLLWFKGDLSDRAQLVDLLRGTEAVIHVAGLVNTPDPEEFTQANVTGTLNMLEAAKQAGVRRFIFVSSLSAREPELSRYGASKARAEQLVKASGLDWTIVRPPAVFGARDTEMLDLFRAAAWGLVPVPRGDREKGAFTSVIHVTDLCRLLLALVPGGSGVSSHSFEPDDGRPGGWSHVALARAIGAAVGRRVLVLRLPDWLMRAAAKADMALRGDKAKLTLDRVGYMTHPDWVVGPGARVPSHIWSPVGQTQGALAATADWYREKGLIR